MTLANRIDEHKKDIENELTPEMREKLKRGMEQILNLRIENRCLRDGAQAPDVRLKTREGREMRLRDYLDSSPVLLNFYRGRWCPICTDELKMYQEFQPQFVQAGIQILAVSPQTIEETAKTQEDYHLSYTVLSDERNHAAREFGINFTLPAEMISAYQYLGVSLPKFNGYDTWELPVPASYLIDTDGKIDWAFVQPDYTQRAEPEEVLHIARDLQKQLGITK